ncbi:hypothetical protein LXL04_029878 [Taraxacum kok-saghyz]
MAERAEELVKAPTIIACMIQAISEQKEIEVEVNGKPSEHRMDFYSGGVLKMLKNKPHIWGYNVSNVGQKKAACIFLTNDKEETIYVEKCDIRVSLEWKYIKGESM